MLHYAGFAKLYVQNRLCVWFFAHNHFPHWDLQSDTYSVCIVQDIFMPGCRDLAHTIQSSHYGLHKRTANIGAWDIFHMQDKDSNLVGHCMCWHTLTKLLMILTQRARTWFQSSRVKVVKQARQATTYNCSLIRLLN